MKIHHDPIHWRRRGQPGPASIEIIWPGSPRQGSHIVRQTYRMLRTAGHCSEVARWWVYDLLKSSVRFEMDGKRWNADYDRTAQLHRVR